MLGFRERPLIYVVSFSFLLRSITWCHMASTSAAIP